MKDRFFGNRWLTIGLIVAIALVAIGAPNWAPAFCLLSLIVRLFIDARLIASIPKWVTNSLAVFVALGVYIQYHNFFMQESSSTLLISLSALKILDYEKKRDSKFLFLLGTLLISLRSLFSIELVWAIPSLAAFFCLWMGLLETQTSAHPTYFLKVILRSIPLTVFLFIVFPRFVLPWAQRQAGHGNGLGFSDEMNPGSHDNLVQNSSPVFRAKFANLEFIKVSQLYWRGSVLTKSNGLKWTVGKSRPLSTKRAMKTGIEYQILLDGDQQNYLFALENPLTLSHPSERIMTFAHSVFKTGQDHERAFSYTGVSNFLPDGDDPVTPEDLEIPEQSPEIRKLADRLRQRSDVAAQVAELDRFFATNGFSYTLSPSVYFKPSIDEFVFKRKLGFCEHFAGAYATLARAMRIPARVVVGFQGGQYNSLGEFWQINTLDSHAWTEVYFGGHWHRRDPTEMVAPLRVSLGAADYFNLSEAEQKTATEVTIQQGRKAFWPTLVNGISNFAANFNFQWTLFFLDFNSGETVQALLAFLSQDLHWILFTILLLFLVPLLFFRRKNKVRQKKTLARQIVHKLIEIDWQTGNLDQTPLRLLTELKTLDLGHNDFLPLLEKVYWQEVYAEGSVPSSDIQDLRRGWRRHAKLLLTLRRQRPREFSKI